ncbi:MAG: hypothetical protein JNM82_09835 [Rhodocyclaceae bacterium]|nr:hypothetical protein [Rhodocyclaceae bacterium]
MPGPMRFASHGRRRPRAARPPAPEDAGAGDPSLLEALREAILSAATPTLCHRLSVVLAEHLVTAVRPAEAFGACVAVATTSRSPRRRRRCQAAMDFLLLPVDAVPEPGNTPACASCLLRLGWALHYRARDELAAAYAGRAVDLGLAPEYLAVACLLPGLIGEARADWAGAVGHYARGCGADTGEPGALPRPVAVRLGHGAPAARGVADEAKAARIHAGLDVAGLFGPVLVGSSGVALLHRQLAFQQGDLGPPRATRCRGDDRQQCPESSEASCHSGGPPGGGQAGGQIPVQWEP